MDKSYKARKEAFVSNLSGGDLWEINLVTLVAPAAILLWSALQSRKSFFNPYRLESYIADFLLNVGGILFAITAYSSAPLLLNALFVFPAILITVLSRPQPNGPKKAGKPAPSGKATGGQTSKTATATPPTTSTSDSPAIKLPIRPFLTTYRGAMLVITCLAILAVDFPIFPRRFAKAENWGTSLMDLGVGSFVFSAGVVSARAILSRSDRIQSTPLPQRLVSAIRHSIPLFVLGLIRLYSVKGLDYAEHVTEYGVHWNFFFTLSLLQPFVEIFHSITTTVMPSYDAVAVLLAIVYEGVLNKTDLKAYILISPRGESLLSKNREGIFSFLGYLAIFLVGRGTGLVVIPEDTSGGTTATEPRATKASDSTAAAKARRHRLMKSLLTRSATWWLLYYVSSTPHIRIPPLIDLGLGITVSRRLANLPYVLWIAAFNDSQILLFCAIETFYFPSAHHSSGSASSAQSALSVNTTPLIMQSYNYNGLIIFLVANLLTGVVNLLVPTLDTTPLVSMCILIGYAAVITGFAVGLKRIGIKIKL